MSVETVRREYRAWLALPRRNCKYCGEKCHGPNDDVCWLRGEMGVCWRDPNNMVKHDRTLQTTD